ncbi:outer membrane lipoprotein carrier protein LolA [Microbacteriaceae bacterium 4G12]
MSDTDAGEDGRCGMTTRRWQRWIPAAVIPVVVVGGALALPLRAGAEVPLPERSPQEVLTLLAESDVEVFSGTVEQTSDLGLPSIPSLSGEDMGLGAGLEALTADHEARVFADGSERFRLQVLDDMGQRELVLNGAEAWTYDFRENEAVRLTLPEGAKERIESRLNELKSEQTLTPSAIVERALAAIDPSTEVTTRDNVRVAGRSAYDLVLSPRTTDTLVGSVAIAVDAETGMPLRASITVRGETEPAASVAFTELSLDAPEASLFTFSPPADADVTEKTLPDDSAGVEARSGEHDATHEKPTIVGSGWSAVAALPAGSVPAEVASNPLLLEATTPVAGGRALSTALFSVLLTDDGRALAGAVPVERLQAAAAAR